MLTKICADCKLTKSVKEFHKNRNSSDGLYYYCKDCSKQHNREYYLKNKTYVKKRNFSYMYGIDFDIYEKMFREQNGKCAICLEDKPLQLDHSHTEEFVRGLLCSACNTALGKFFDNPDLLRKAATYLDTANSNPNKILTTGKVNKYY